MAVEPGQFSKEIGLKQTIIFKRLLSTFEPIYTVLVCQMFNLLFLCAPRRTPILRLGFLEEPKAWLYIVISSDSKLYRVKST